MNRFRSFLVSSLALLFAGPACLTAVAAPIDGADAARAVFAWVSQNPVPMDDAIVGCLPDNVKTVVNSDGTPTCHVVSLEGGGYVVVAADDRISPIVLFSAAEETPEPDDRNPFWAFLSGEMEARMEEAGLLAASRRPVLAAGNGDEDADPLVVDPAETDCPLPEDEWAALLAYGAESPHRVSATSTPSDVRVPKLLFTRWDQDDVGGRHVFNLYTPFHYVCGCSATAMAQILRFHRQPASPVAPKTYSCAVDGKTVVKTMMGGTYDWSNMAPVPSPSTLTAAQCAAIGRLTYDCGVAQRMDWGFEESGTDPDDTAPAFKEAFGYESAEYEWNSAGFGNASFRRLLCTNLDAGYPCFLAIFNAKSGHAVVADGYGFSGGSLFIHLNMGWSGSYDTWYCLPRIRSFNRVSGIVYNIYPTGTGDIVSGRILSASGKPLAGASVSAILQGDTIATTRSNARGIYSFRLPAGSAYTIRAESDGRSGSRSATLSPTSRNTWGADVTLNEEEGGPSTPANALDCPNLDWTLDGSPAWHSQTETTHDGADALRSGAIPDDGSTSLRTSVPGPGTLSFWYRVSSEADRDCLRFSIDGETLLNASGDTGWRRFQTTLGTGTHSLVWTYSKDSAERVGEDCAWLDEVSWLPASLQAALDNTALDFSTGGYSRWFFTTRRNADGVDSAQSGPCSDGKASWMTTSLEGPGTLSFRWKVSSEADYDWLELWIDGKKKARISGMTSWAVKSVAISGSGRHTVTWRYVKDALFSDGEDCGWVDMVRWNPTVSLATALDNPSLAFSTGGYAKWHGTTNRNADGVDSAQSGACAAGKASWMSTSVQGSGTLSFRWKVSSEADYDWLELWIDGKKKARISGMTSWAVKSVAISGPGRHTVTWRYVKDALFSDGEDCGWVDMVRWSR